MTRSRWHDFSTVELFALWDALTLRETGRGLDDAAVDDDASELLALELVHEARRRGRELPDIAFVFPEL